MRRQSASDIRRSLPREGAVDRSAHPAGSLTAQVTRRIREAIMDGRLALGEALSELKLAAALNVSRTPVRDALTALQLGVAREELDRGRERLAIMKHDILTQRHGVPRGIRTNHDVLRQIRHIGALDCFAHES